jgi:hypothetical protein
LLPRPADGSRDSISNLILNGGASPAAPKLVGGLTALALEIGADMARRSTGGHYEVEGLALRSGTATCEVESGDFAAALASAPRGTAIDPLGTAVLVGAALAALVVAEEFAGVGPGTTRVDAVALVEGTWRGPVARSPGWRGFLRVGGGWLSLAVSSRAERRRFLDVLESAGWGLSASKGVEGVSNPDVLATRCQEVGLAALAARPAAVKPGPPAPPPSRVPGRRPYQFPSRPLTGVRIVEVGQLVAAPYASEVFATLGAQVTAISHPERVSSRWYGDAEPLDLTVSSDRERFLQLRSVADVVVDNLTHRFWPNLDLEPLPAGRGTHVKISGFGADDEHASWRAYGFQMEALHRAGAAPIDGAAALVKAPLQPLLDHAAGLSAVAVALGAMLRGSTGSLGVSLDAIARSAAARASQERQRIGVST